MVNIPSCIRQLTVDEDSELVSRVDRRTPFRSYQIGCACGEPSVELLGYRERNPRRRRGKSSSSVRLECVAGRVEASLK